MSYFIKRKKKDALNSSLTSQPQVVARWLPVSKSHSGRGLGEGVVFGGGELVPPGFA